MAFQGEKGSTSCTGNSCLCSIPPHNALVWKSDRTQSPTPLLLLCNSSLLESSSARGVDKECHAQCHPLPCISVSMAGRSSNNSFSCLSHRLVFPQPCSRAHTGFWGENRISDGWVESEEVDSGWVSEKLFSNLCHRTSGIAMDWVQILLAIE